AVPPGNVSICSNLHHAARGRRTSPRKRADSTDPATPGQSGNGNGARTAKSAVTNAAGAIRTPGRAGISGDGERANSAAIDRGEITCFVVGRGVDWIGRVEDRAPRQRTGTVAIERATAGVTPGSMVD